MDPFAVQAAAAGVAAERDARTDGALAAGIDLNLAKRRAAGAGRGFG